MWNEKYGGGRGTLCFEPWGIGGRLINCRYSTTDGNRETIVIPLYPFEDVEMRLLKKYGRCDGNGALAFWRMHRLSVFVNMFRSFMICFVCNSLKFGGCNIVNTPYIIKRHTRFFSMHVMYALDKAISLEEMPRRRLTTWLNMCLKK